MIKIKKYLLIIVVLLLVISLYIIFFNKATIVAYEATDDVGRHYLYCFCNHKGYYLLTQQKLLWYTPQHNDISEIGQIIKKNGSTLKYKKDRDYLDEKTTENDILEIKMTDDFIYVEVNKDEKIKLKKALIKINKILNRKIYQLIKKS